MQLFYIQKYYRNPSKINLECDFVSNIDGIIAKSVDFDYFTQFSGFSNLSFKCFVSYQNNEIFRILILELRIFWHQSIVSRHKFGLNVLMNSKY